MHVDSLRSFNWLRAAAYDAEGGVAPLKPYRNRACGCARRTHHAGFLIRKLGIAFMVIGGLILLVSLPAQVWFAFVGLILILFGLILLRVG